MLKKLQNRKKRHTSQDPFIQRLRSSVIGEGMLAEGNIALMDHAIRHMPEGGQVLEIGCWAGLSSTLLLHLMKKYDRKVPFLACDPWIYEGYRDSQGEISAFIDGRDDLGRKAFMDYIRQAYIHALSFFHPSSLPATFQLTSDAFFAHFSQNDVLTDIFGRETKLGGSIAFCYIDGNHAYEFAKRDFEHVSEYLLPEGFILLDDSGDGTPFGSARLIKEIKKNPAFAVVDKNPNYLLRKLY